MSDKEKKSKIDEVVERKFRDQDLEFEIAGYILRESPALLDKIESEWFSNEFVYEIIEVAKAVRETMPKAVIYRELKRAGKIDDETDDIYKSIITSIFSIDESHFKDKFQLSAIDQLREYYEARTVIFGIRDVISGITSGKLNIKEVKTNLLELSRPVIIKGEDTTTGNYVDDFDWRKENVKNRRNDEESFNGLGTGIRVFDTITGGLMKGEFGVIGGRPGIGKTATLGSFALYNWRFQNKNVLFITGEMPRLDIGLRFDSAVSGIPAVKFRFGNLTEDEYDKWEKSITYEKNQRENFLEIVSFPRAFTAKDIELAAMKAQDKYRRPVEAVYIDYINIMASVSDKKKKVSNFNWESQAEAIWEVKELYATLNGGVSGWSAGQIKDEAITASVLTLADLKYGRAISETSPVVVGLVQTENDEFEEVMELQLLKMRGAEIIKKAIILHPNLSYMRIHEEVVSCRNIMDLVVVKDKIKSKRVQKGAR